MFKPIENSYGTVEIPDAYGVMFNCVLPPMGYGVNPDTGELGKTDIIKRSPIASEQYWEREDLPKWYREKRRVEALVQESDPDAMDTDCENFRASHWRRRLFGVWVYMGGEPVYLTGLHWFMLNWWKYGGAYMDYRKHNRDAFYALDYCIEDPDCLGMITLAKRRDGKTLMASVFLYEYISRNASKFGGIQSKTDSDAKDVFKKGIVMPWRSLPHFFRPVYDEAGSDNPKSELRFQKTARKGRKARIEDNSRALESVIDFRQAGVAAYDGAPLHRYVSDEAGKLKDVSVLERHETVRFCAELNGRYIGKFLYSTTVELMESGGSEFQKLVKLSDRRELTANNRTKSGLYAFFTPAFKTLYPPESPNSKYGIPDEEFAMQYYMNERKALENDPRALASYIRKNPFTLAEAFRVDGEKSLFNPEKIHQQLDWLSWHDHIIERGNFEWKDGERFTEVEWRPSKNGRWGMPVGFKMEEPNKIEKKGERYFPRNNISFRIGMDPFKYDKAKNNRRSDCAAFVGKMEDPARPSDPFNNAVICRYRHRAATTGMANEDILKMGWFFGCQVLGERNVDHFKDYFVTCGCEGFLMKLDGEDEYGVYSDGHGNMIQSLCDLIEDHVEHNNKKIFFKETLTEFLEFDVGNTTAFDETIAFGITLIAMKKRQYRRPSNGPNNEVGNFFKRYKAYA